MYGVQTATASRAAPIVSTHMTTVATGLQSESTGSPRRETKHKLIKPALATKNTNKPERPTEAMLGVKPTLCPTVTKFMKMIISQNH